MPPLPFGDAPQHTMVRRPRHVAKRGEWTYEAFRQTGIGWEGSLLIDRLWPECASLWHAPPL